DRMPRDGCRGGARALDLWSESGCLRSCRPLALPCAADDHGLLRVRVALSWASREPGSSAVRADDGAVVGGAFSQLAEADRKRSSRDSRLTRLGTDSRRHMKGLVSI